MSMCFTPSHRGAITLSLSLLWASFLLVVFTAGTAADRVLINYDCSQQVPFLDVLQQAGLSVYRRLDPLCTVGVEGPQALIQRVLSGKKTERGVYLASQGERGEGFPNVVYAELEGVRTLGIDSMIGRQVAMAGAAASPALPDAESAPVPQGSHPGAVAASPQAVGRREEGGSITEAAALPIDELRTCSPGCLFKDTIMAPGSDEVLPFGVHMIEANTSDVGGMLPENTKDKGIVICLIDSGVDATHPDMMGNFMTGCDDPSTCVQPWSQDLVGHGTHVAGILAALRNGVGVVGVIPAGAALHVVRIFNDTGATTSEVVVAMMECKKQLQYRQQSNPATKMVVSMSFSGTQFSKTEEKFVDEAFRKGDMLFVAAAGNTGQNLTSYPAGYDSVVSVGAVDCASRHANYSCISPDVEMSAPGTNVRSSVPLAYTKRDLVGSLSLPDFPKVFIDTLAMVTSAEDALVGSLHDCGDGHSYADWMACRLVAPGSICMVKHRFDVYACDVVTAALKVGCKAFVLWHNSTDGCSMGVGVSHWMDGCVQQPGQLPLGVAAVGVAHEDGVTLRRLLSARPGLRVSLRVWGLKGPYDYRMGTSMATPYVSALAARLWAAGANCSSKDVRSALQEGAKDLGLEGRDYIYGFGLVKAKAAFHALSKMGCFQTLAEVSSMG